MEGFPWIRESEHLFGNKNLLDDYVKISSKYTSESSNAKRKVESLFCVMRKRICRHKSVDDYMFPDLDNADESDLRFENLLENPYDPLDECSIVDSDTDLSESSELFDVISEHVLEDKDLISGSEDIYRCSINKEDPEVPCNYDTFKNDYDNSSAIEVRYGDVVNMHESMEKMWNKDDDPIPISIVPPDDGWPRILLERCSLDPILGISSMPLTKTLERPSRLWSVCGSIAAVRNLPLLEDCSGACSSLDGQFYVNVSNSEDRDEELARTPSTLYQEEVDGGYEISFSDIDAMIRRLNLVPDDSDSCLNREEWNMSKHPSHALLEQCTRTSMRRAIMSQGAFAVLHGRDSKHFVRKHEVVIGRSSDGLKVDIDLGKYGYGSKISRRQALVKLENNGSFSIKNLGKQHILIDGEKLDTGQIVTLTSCSSVDIRGITFVFKINKEAVRQFLKKNNKGRKSHDDTKFRWCE
ncbi:hypothetical protein V5N11_027019 [Cardamine amara subsp. amara]|uniref:FHA domain-containing protein n=1 Tax=Cardamine amara subsp. amara TaxID=228776 RepID=A0ABD0ZZT8_CARAN